MDQLFCDQFLVTSYIFSKQTTVVPKNSSPVELCDSVHTYEDAAVVISTLMSMSKYIISSLDSDYTRRKQIQFSHFCSSILKIVQQILYTKFTNDILLDNLIQKKSATCPKKKLQHQRKYSV